MLESSSPTAGSLALPASAQTTSAGPGVVMFIGELDMLAKDLVVHACLATEGRDVTLDLQATSFMDCRGFGALVTARHELNRRGQALHIRNAVGQPARLMALLAQEPDPPEPPTELDSSDARPPSRLAAALQPAAAEIRRAYRRLHLKALVIVSVAVTSYLALVVPGLAAIPSFLFAPVLAVALTATATSILHDGNHGSFSTSRAVSRLAGYTSDLMGGSSWLWRIKHNRLHHGNTNVVGVDSDIDQSPFARLAVDQPWRPWHRYQHIYMWFLYGMLTLRVLLIADFRDIRRGAIGSQPLPRAPGRRERAVLMSGKLAHVVWAIAVPLAFHPWWAVAAFYVAISWTVGLLLGTMFQLAHCTGLTEFPGAEQPRRGAAFIEHQLRTTADVRCRTQTAQRCLSWIMGGLDHQVEHHLAPRLPHTVYPLVTGRLTAACAALGLRVRSHPTPWQAIRAHEAWLRSMGRPTRLS